MRSPDEQLALDEASARTRARRLMRLAGAERLARLETEWAEIGRLLGVHSPRELEKLRESLK